MDKSIGCLFFIFILKIVIFGLAGFVAIHFLRTSEDHEFSWHFIAAYIISVAGASSYKFSFALNTSAAAILIFASVKTGRWFDFGCSLCALTLPFVSLITSLHDGQPLEAWFLAKILGFFRISLLRKLFARLDPQTSANILSHIKRLKRVQILRGINTDEAAHIIFWMMPNEEIATQTLRSRFLGNNKRMDIIAAIARIDQGRAEEIRAPLRRVLPNEQLPAAIFPQITIAELRAQLAQQQAQLQAQFAGQLADQLAQQQAQLQAQFAGQLADQLAQQQAQLQAQFAGQLAGQLAQQQAQLQAQFAGQLADQLAQQQAQLQAQFAGQLADQLAQQQAQFALERAGLNNMITSVRTNNALFFFMLFALSIQFSIERSHFAHQRARPLANAFRRYADRRFELREQSPTRPSSHSRYCLVYQRLPCICHRRASALQ